MRIRALLVLALVALVAAAAAPSAGAGSLKRLLAPASACPGAVDLDAPVGSRSARCSASPTSPANSAASAASATTSELDRSAGRKSARHPPLRQLQPLRLRARIHLLDEARRLPAVSCWRVGENIAWGVGDYGTVRAIFNAWLHSPEHREPTSSAATSRVGVGLRVGGLEGRSDAHVWVQHFGSHCGARRRRRPRRTTCARTCRPPPSAEDPNRRRRLKARRNRMDRWRRRSSSAMATATWRPS